MGFSVVLSRAYLGVDAPLVTVEAHLSGGLPSLSIVGLPETAVRESKDRVRSAIINSQFDFPDSRIIINLAPADLPKHGSRFDLAIALGILAASEQIDEASLRDKEFVAELALDGALRGVPGIIPAALASKHNHRALFIAHANSSEAAIADAAELYPATSLLSVCNHLKGEIKLQHFENEQGDLESWDGPDLADVQGQPMARRALEIAAAGKHSLLFIGPPGTGKTMLASRLPSLLPKLAQDQAQEVAAVHSVAGHTVDYQRWLCPPFRSPHHTASAAALVGGGNPPKPGEISLAHHGVLFLDELPEFDRKVLEVLREPLETGSIAISRASHQARFPASFQLIAAMNPCPCGYLGDPNRSCGYTCEKATRYRGKLSGPLLDRIDLQVEVPAIKLKDLTQSNQAQENSSTVKLRVIKARNKQLMRNGKANSALTQKEIKQFCTISPKDLDMLTRCIEKMGLSARAYYRVLKVARTIADIADSESIETDHWLEAVNYRLTEKK